MDSPRPDGSRIGLVVGLLASSLVIALALAGQTQYAVLSHRRTVESVLSSSAVLAAEELVRRSSSEAGYQGYLRALEALPGLVPGPGETALRSAAGAPVETARALSLVESVFVLETGGLRFVGPAPSSAVTAWLSAKLAAGASVHHPIPFAVAAATLDGRARLFVWSARRGESRIGFEVALGALTGVFERSLARGPLVPAALSQGKVPNAALSITVRDHAGGIRFRAGPETFGNGARVPFGDSYGGALEGFVAEVSIDPSQASRLVPGGLPRSRLPVLLGLLAVSAALVVTAGLQVRRERDLARLREAFVAGVSHELRTPLAQIRLFAETLLLGRTRSSQEERNALEVIDREARRLGHLVENVLAFSRTAATPALHRVELDVASLARETVDGFRPLASVRRASIVLDAEGGVRACVDAGALSQVLLNLLENAVKYGPAGQVIAVRVRSARGSARLEVEDGGSGVPARDRRRVFERFRRLPNAAASGIAGAGIGLSVVREIVEAHGGRTFVEEGAGGGARFVVELPAAAGLPA